MRQNSKTSIAEEQQKYRSGYIIQSCSTCAWNWDFELHGRTLQCGGCGAWNRESGDKKHKLVRVG